MLGHDYFFSVLVWFEEYNIHLGKEEAAQLYQSTGRDKKISFHS
jgi:hypothetical protein